MNLITTLLYLLSPVLVEVNHHVQNIIRYFTDLAQFVVQQLDYKFDYLSLVHNDLTCVAEQQQSSANEHEALTCKK